MRLLKSNLLTDGKLFNDGRPVDLIQIEEAKDFDVLLGNILRSGYYDSSYFDTHIDYREGEVKFDSFFLSSILKFLKPESVLELGCGRGDILFLLGLDHKVKVQGIEFSPDALKKVWPFLNDKVKYGDSLEVCKNFRGRKIQFDTFCAFDFWEHLHPKALHEAIDSLVALAEKDALFLFTIPAIGEDRVFGEIFPLELEENRDNFNRRVPFSYLNAESLDPAIPANGHLIWSHTEWWQNQFETHGLFRAEELERNIHRFFDEHLFYARKSFYLFFLNSPAAKDRLKRLLRNQLTLFKKWKILVEQQECIGHFMKNQGKCFIDLEELKLTINHAEFYMTLDLKKQIERWTGKSLQDRGIAPFIRPVICRVEKWAYDYLDDYLRKYKKKHYLV